MKIKLDENIGRRGGALLRDAGHDVSTVAEQNLQGASDRALYEVCAAEDRTLITLDRGFGEVLRFAEPRGSIVILDVGRRVTLEGIMSRLRAFNRFAESRANEGELWVVGPARVRVRPQKT